MIDFYPETYYLLNKQIEAYSAYFPDKKKCGFSEENLAVFLEKVPQIENDFLKYVIIGGWAAELLIKQHPEFKNYSRFHKDLDLSLACDIYLTDGLPIDIMMPEHIEGVFGINVYDYEPVKIISEISQKKYEVVVSPVSFLLDCLGSGRVRRSRPYMIEEEILKNLN